jgi:bifunctional non-homologous end joining protein LigD
MPAKSYPRRKRFHPAAAAPAGRGGRSKRDQPGSFPVQKTAARRIAKGAGVNLPEDLEAALAESPSRRIPSSLRPALATLSAEVPQGEKWLHEIKFDGYRILAHLSGPRTRLLSRRGNDWTGRFTSIAAALARLPFADTVIDGEIVVVDANGKSDFQALQNLMRRGHDEDTAYYAFDLPYYRGRDITAWRLADRKRLLAAALGPSTNGPATNAGSMIRLSEHIAGSGEDVVRHACRYGLEGIVSKHADSPYLPRRTTDWLKTKCLRRQEFVVGGWTNRSTGQPGVGSLLLGYYDGNELIYCGRVGTGFTETTQQELRTRLAPLAADEPPFADASPGYHERGTHYVRPDLVVEVQFGHWTDSGILRHAAFKGVREDKDPKQVHRETAKYLSGKSLDTVGSARAKKRATSKKRPHRDAPR